MNAPTRLFFDDFAVRVDLRDGAPWFVLADVCRVLEIGNPSQAASRLDDDERGIITNDTLGGPQEMTVINESGLYSLILTSRKPAAKRFKKWITAEVLPSIRGGGIDVEPAMEDRHPMPGNLLPFNFDGGPVRAVVLDGDPWFVGKDVAERLGYADTDQALRSHCKRLKLLKPVELTGLGFANPPPRGLLVIPEPDVYRLTARSKLPDAERFEEWLFETVLPSIRRTGAYAVPPPPPEDDGVQVGPWRELELTAGREDARRRDLEMVAEARRIFGRSAARALWAGSALPWPGDEGGGLDPDSERLPADLEQALAFLDAATVAEPAGRVQASKLYAAYRRWCGGRREETVNENRFGRLMTACRVSRSKICGLNVYLGRRLAGCGA